MGIHISDLKNFLDETVDLYNQPFINSLAHFFCRNSVKVS